MIKTHRHQHFVKYALLYNVCRTQAVRKVGGKNMGSVKAGEAGETQYQYQNFQSRSRLDARLWISCRYALVQSMMAEIRGLGQIKGKQDRSRVGIDHW